MSQLGGFRIGASGAFTALRCKCFMTFSITTAFTKLSLSLFCFTYFALLHVTEQICFHFNGGLARTQDIYDGVFPSRPWSGSAR
jgi:hypothetical protein